MDVNIVKNDVLDQDAFRAWMPEYANAEFILENGKYIQYSSVSQTFA